MAGINWFHVGFVAPLLGTFVAQNFVGKLFPIPEWVLYIVAFLIFGMVVFHLNKGISDLFK